MKWITGLFKSKKFTAMAAAFLVFVFNDKLGWGISAETIEQIVYVVGSFVIGQGISDGLSKGATSNIAKEE